MISGIAIALMLLLFAGLVFWAWSGRRQHDFSEAAALALEDESAPARQGDRP
jgi:cytochrome c oxidase cbb3-type subunit 4